MTANVRIGFCVSGEGRLFKAAAQLDRLTVTDLVLDTGADQSLHGFCADRGIRVWQLDGDTQAVASGLTRALTDSEADLWCLTFNRLVPDALVERHRGRMVNVHPSLLPAFPGFGAVPALVESGALFGGATIHEVDEGTDSGPIVAQCVVSVEPGESPETIGARTYGLLQPMLLQVLEWYAEGRVTHDDGGRVRVERARYGRLPISPELENEYEVTWS